MNLRVADHVVLSMYKAERTRLNNNARTNPKVYCVCGHCEIESGTSNWQDSGKMIFTSCVHTLPWLHNNNNANNNISFLPLTI